MVDAGKVLERAMRARRWSQGELKRQLNARRDVPISNGLVSKWISGKRTPNRENAMALADLLDIDPRVWPAASGRAA